MSFEDLLNKNTIVYRRNIYHTNSFGESDYTLEQVSSFSCALQPSKEELVFHRGGKDYVATNIMYCSYGEDIHPGDYVDIDNNRYLVLSVQDDGGRGHHFKCYLIRN